VIGRAILLGLLGIMIPASAIAAAGDTVRITGEVFVTGARTAGVVIEVRRRPVEAPAVHLVEDERESLHPEWALDPVLLPGPPLAATRTDVEGRFRFEGLEPGRFVILATAPAGGQVWRNVAILEPGETEDIEISICGWTHTLRGRARFADGTPFHGEIRVGFFGWPVEDEWCTLSGIAETSPEGQFTIPGLERGLTQVYAVMPGRLRVFLGTVVLPCDAQVDLTVDENLAVTRGRLVDTHGLPAAGVRLLAAGDGADRGGWQDAEVLAGVRTDAEGRFRMLGPLAPEWRIVGSDRYLSEVEPRGPADGNLVLVARARPRVHGVVRRSSDGSPVPGVPVLASGSAVALTDEEGRYTLAAPGPDTVIAAWGRGWVPPGGPDGVISLRLEDGEEKTLDLSVVPAARLSGRVVDENGEPVAGASISLMASPFRSDALNVFIMGSVGPRTDETGQFVIDYLPSGVEVTVSVIAPGHVSRNADWDGVGRNSRSPSRAGRGVLAGECFFRPAPGIAISASRAGG